MSTLPGTGNVPGKHTLIKRRPFLDCESLIIFSVVLMLMMVHENEPRVYAALSSGDLDTVNMLCIEFVKSQPWWVGQHHVLQALRARRRRREWVWV